jgi:hypothetical protein
MANFTDCKFQNTIVVLDGHEYIGCEFLECRIVVTRGNFVLKNSSFDSCTFEFGGEAANIRDLVVGLLNQPPKQPQPASSQVGTAQPEVGETKHE